MLSYILAGLGLGSIYAIAASGLVISYVASGIFNLAFAAMAFTVARFFYFLNSEHGWSILPAAVVSLLIFAPALGMALYGVLFRHLRLRSPLIKLMATVGLSVALPPLVTLVFGRLTSATVPGLAPRPLHAFHPFGAVLNGDQIATYLGLLIVLGVGVSVLRFSDVGLKVRALVDSEALTGMSGTRPGMVSLGVWASSAMLAGLAGILIAPTSGLTVENMTYLMTAAFAAVVAARLRSLPIAVGVAMVMGVVTDVIQKYMDPSSSFSAAVLPSVPFAFMFVFLVYYAVRGRAGDTAAGGALDRAIRPEGGDPSLVSSTIETKGRMSRAFIGTVVVVAIIAICPAILDSYWAGLFAAGIALSIALLSYTLVTGEGGMVWLSQITFAGGGAVLSAELVTRWGWSPLAAVFIGALVIVPVGLAVGVLTIRLGNLYVALVTLTFGSLIQTLILTQDPFYNFGSGQAISRPSFASDNATFAFLGLAVFLVFGLLIVNLRGSTAGMAMSAVRWSENGAKTLGISVLQTKMLVTGVATYVAAAGGGFLAMNFGSTLPDTFSPFIGLVWLAVLVTMGARSVIAALVAGVLFYVMPGIFATYVPTKFGDVPTILFGLGAIGLAVHPEGAVLQTSNNLLRLMSRRRRSGNPQPDVVDLSVPVKAPAYEPSKGHVTTVGQK